MNPDRISTPMHRLGHFTGGRWEPYSHPAVFEMSDRVMAGVPGSDPAVFERLIACLAGPYHLLYVLHTPRGEAAPGRYQSDALTLSEVSAFLHRFRPLLSGDGRFDLWAHSPGDAGTIVWDRHDLLYAYGPVDRYAEILHGLGFVRGTPSMPSPHEHHYQATLDPLAHELMTALAWSCSPLHPEDEQ